MTGTGRWNKQSGSGHVSGPEHAPASGSFEREVQSGTAAQWWPRLVAMLDQQRALCVTLDEMSTRQQGLVRLGETDAVLGLLGERQAVIERLTAITAQLAPFRGRRDELLASLAAAERERYTRLLDEIAGLVERIKQRDEVDRVELERQRVDVTRELTGFARGRGAVAAYGDSSRAGARGSGADERG